MNPLEDLEQALLNIVAEMDHYREKHRHWVTPVHPSNKNSALNYLDYLAFRRQDRTALQARLNEYGLSSLGRSDANIRQQVQAVLRILQSLLGKSSEPWQTPSELRPPSALTRRVDELFGANRHRRRSRIMVTMPTQAAGDKNLVSRLLLAGMDVARINCAHDGAEIWQAIADNVREAAQASGLQCLIQMDLAGPKLRTGPVPSGPRTLKVKPPKDLRGEVVHSVIVGFYPGNKGGRPSNTEGPFWLPVEVDSFAHLPRLEKLAWEDARGKKRSGKVVGQTANAIEVEVAATTYFEEGQALKGLFDAYGAVTLRLASLPAQENHIPIRVGDCLRLVGDGRVARFAEVGEQGQVLAPAVLSCATPEVLQGVQLGERVKFDDGKFTAMVVAKDEQGLLVEFDQAPAKGGKLKAEKGVNFPDSSLPLPGFTEEDRRDLHHVVRIADIVALSFVNHYRDVEQLQAALTEEGRAHMPLVLKIETQRACEHLPQLMLTGLRSPRVGVMIARGDLSVEIGWRKIAEQQEEIMWLSAAAHIPVIWATQVLESMAKKGSPTRGEITDAAMAQRAECIMLNKGPYIEQALAMINDIAKTMDLRQEKKSALLPSIDLAVLDEPEEDPVPEGVSP